MYTNSMLTMLENYLYQIKGIFANTKDRHEAHKKADPVLREMATQREVLHDIIRHNLSDPEFLLKKRHHCILRFDIEEDEEISFMAHCWMPRPDRKPHISHQSIHHHGNLLLSTVSAFGSGYSSILFEPGYKIDDASSIAGMKVAAAYQNQLHNLAFCDAYVPHVATFPEDVSITYALWSYDKRYPFTNFRRSSLVQKIKYPILKVIKGLNLGQTVGVNDVAYFDFYPQGGYIRGLKDRVFGYEEDTNDNFLQNIFHILQQVEFTDRAFLEGQRKLHNSLGHDHVVTWIDRFLAGDTIEDEFIEHTWDPRINFHLNDALTACGYEGALFQDPVHNSVV